MSELYIRLDGAIGDIITEFNDYSHMLSAWPGQPKMPPGNLLFNNGLSELKRKSLEIARGQPEPYRKMKIFKGVEDAIKRVQNENFKVWLYSDEIQKSEKEEWMRTHGIFSIIDGFRWISTETLLLEKKRNRIIITTLFDNLSNKKPFHKVLYFIGYDREKFYDNFSQKLSLIKSWEDFKI